MACRLFGTKPSSEPMLHYDQLEPWEQISVKLYLKFEPFIQENAFENIVWEKISAILSRLQYVKMKIAKYNLHTTVSANMILICSERRIPP